MKSKIVLFFFIALAPLSSYAQGCITIFSEDGDKFFLVLNGVRQNPAPQTNVRVDGLPGDFYDAKILFEDPAKPRITKNIPMKDAMTHEFRDMTFKIKKNKDGELKMRFFSQAPVPVNYTPPADMYVAHYGQPVQTGNTATQTTVTTTSGTADGNGSIGITPGVSMNIDVPAQPANTVTQTTTTTRPGYQKDNGGYSNRPAPAAAGCQHPMDWNSFKSARETVVKAEFEDTKLSAAKAIVGANCISAEQVVQICKIFGFEATKLSFAKFAYAKTTDPRNYFKVNNVFDFDASKTELNNFISNGGR